ncbi:MULTISPECIES: HAMP domain-containing sensor histidine kinase [Pseudoxanthomonas]|uniref:histidine kinase n=1 Tax=Pseudoxanthomonas winnipegensis TaxID=2480810 RepID=A0AAW8GAK5_9GAMM|nr:MULTISPECIES: HAMP domain-containing sensor histidine kinase [Pseudoxanthomonas]MDQ1119379.1 two-component system OmpR family sensor kinase [Pseudoxanthomonas winnipegensis]MDQ1132571.1 two-component system OmpR family sensor kinase [Pseudoxanthomonas winnipegensis]MDR6137419.1 two-component system OmpR family sensor kinase [Pseudoxanthomonas sp. SORGH_AS_0997]
MRPPPILVQVAALALVTLALAFALCFGIVLATPTPAPIRMSVREAAAALDGQHGGRFRIEPRAAPPGCPRVAPVEATLAQATRTQPGRVRACWLDAAGAGKASGNGQSVVLVGDRTLLVDSDARGFQMRYDADARVGMDTSLPAFTAAIQGSDGRWRTLTPIDQRLAGWRLRMTAAFGVAMALLALPVWFAARRLSRPIQRLARAAAISDLDSGAGFPLDGPPELRAVGEAMNAMHARLARHAGERLQAFAAVAHDLRTPLTGLRIRAELVPGADRQRMIGDLDRMAAMIEQMLAYAHAQAQPARLRPVDLDALVAGIAVDRVSLGQDVAFVPTNRDTRLQADPTTLHRAIDNLLDNALRFAGSARLSIEAHADRIDLHIDDAGPGIPEDQLAGITTPFKRLESSRSRATGGAGLGLAIGERIAEAHGGRLLLANRTPHGLRATLSLPLR